MLEVSQMPAYKAIPEPLLLFGDNNTDIHPLRGLIRYGPYSSDIGFPSELRVASLAPQRYHQKLTNIIIELKNKAVPQEIKNYYPVYNGFSKVYRIPLVFTYDRLKFNLDIEATGLVRNQDGDKLSTFIANSLISLSSKRKDFDVILLYLPSEWKSCFKYEGFDLHDRVKAKIAHCDLPVQFITDASISRRCRANVLWGLSIALYAKAGGIPWKLANLSKDEAYIGISYAINKKVSGNDYATCCSQVFDTDGTGFEFVAYDTREFTTDVKGNPYLSYQEMQSVLSKSLLLYQRRHCGRIPQKIFIHKNTPFKDDEIQGSLNSFNERTEVELIQVIRRPRWVGLKYDRDYSGKVAPTGYPLERGCYMPLTVSECLLWTQGSVNDVDVSGRNTPVFKEGALKPIPTPIIVRRFSGNGGWHDTCSGILSLTKMDWNNNTLYKTLPVTLVYSKRFSDVVKLTPEIVNGVYDYRTFM